ncbi:MAG: glycosyltransferase family 39 protein [Chloroflexota bacterium]
MSSTTEIRARTPADERRFYLVLSVVGTVALGSTLRLYGLGDWSFWIEEHHSLRHAANMTSLQDVLTSMRPVFSLLLKPVLALFGVSEWSARLVPAIAGTATIPYLFWEVRRLFGTRTAVIAALLLAIAPWHIYWSQNARFYTLLLLLSTASLLSFYRALENDSLPYLALAFVTFALSVATHMLGALLLPVLIAYFILLKLLRYELPRGYRLRYLLVFILLPFLAYLLMELVRAILGERAIVADLIGRFMKGSPRQSFGGYSSPYGTIANTLYYIGTPLALFSITGALMLFWRKSRAGLLVSVGAFVPFGIIVALTPFATVSNRYAFMTLAFWIVLAAVAMHRLYRQARRSRFGVSALILAGIVLLLFKDMAVKDIVYYASTNLPFRVFTLLLVGVIAPVSVYLATRPEPHRHRTTVRLVAFVLILPLLHAILADTLYYAFQDGHRNNWKAVVDAVADYPDSPNLIVTSSPTLASYYLPEQTFSPQHIGDVSLEQLFQEEPRFWVLEDHGFDRAESAEFAGWQGEHCTLVRQADHFVAGRNWRTRAYLCSNLAHVEG